MEIRETINERKIINTCSTCRIPIYEGESIYISSAGVSSGRTGGIYGGAGGKTETGVPGLAKGVGVGVGVGVHRGVYGGKENIETWTQCAWCYDQWQEELRKDYWFWPKWLTFWLLIDAIFLAWYGNGVKGDENLKFWNLECRWASFKLGSMLEIGITSRLICITVSSVLFIVALGYLCRPRVNRYKIRERK